MQCSKITIVNEIFNFVYYATLEVGGQQTMIPKKFPVWLTIEEKDRTLFRGLTVLYGLYVLPLILANRFYQDDLSRSLHGVTGWNNDARPLTERLMRWLGGGFPLGDVFPLTLLLAVLLLAYTVTLYTKRYLPDGGFLFPALSIGFLVIANPFFLSDLSYRFDSVTMTLALCAAILPYVVPPRKALWKIFSFSFLLCMIVFTTYQPAVGVYVSLWFLELFYMFFASRIDLPRLFVRIAACGCSAVLYKYVILNRLIRPANGGWQPDAYRFAWRSEEGLSSGISQNFQMLLHYIRLILQGVPKPLILLFAALIIGGMICAGVTLFRRRRPLHRRIFSLVCLILLPLLMLLGAAGPLLVLAPSSFSVSVHSLLCLCSLGLWAGGMLTFLPPARRKLWSLLFLPCLLFGLTFSYTYGNALTSQKQYEEYLTYSIVHDIETLNADGAYGTLTVSGRAPRSPETARLCEKYPIFSELVPTYLTNSSYIGGAQILHYTQETFAFDSLTEEDRELMENTQPVLANSVYSCYENGGKIIIRFHQGNTD